MVLVPNAHRVVVVQQVIRVDNEKDAVGVLVLVVATRVLLPVVHHMVDIFLVAAVRMIHRVEEDLLSYVCSIDLLPTCFLFIYILTSLHFTSTDIFIIRCCVIN